jgi:hypothetical protein
LGVTSARVLRAVAVGVRELDDLFAANMVALEVEAELVGAVGARGAGETDGVCEIAERGP